MTKGKKAIIVGASSGIGYEVARLLLQEGWRLGLAARRTETLEALRREFQDQVVYAPIDVTQEESEERLLRLIDAVGGMDLYLHVAGVGWQNMDLLPEKELPTVSTNALGFARFVGAAYRYFAVQGHGHIAVVSSIAGTKGLGVAPAYSASKAFCNVYIEALEQQAHLRHLDIHFTDLRPGFVRTDLLGDGKHYPMLMSAESVAKDPPLVVAEDGREKLGLYCYMRFTSLRSSTCLRFSMITSSSSASCTPSSMVPSKMPLLDVTVMRRMLRPSLSESISATSRNMP